MVITLIAKSGTALLIAGTSTSYPNFMRIGSGSGAELNTATGLYAEHTGLHKAFTETTVSTLRKVKWTGDWNSVEMSGLQLTEFALSLGSTGNQIYHYVNLGNAISFDGTNELRVEINWELQ